MIGAAVLPVVHDFSTPIRVEFLVTGKGTTNLKLKAWKDGPIRSCRMGSERNRHDGRIANAGQHGILWLPVLDLDNRAGHGLGQECRDQRSALVPVDAAAP